MGAVNAGDNVVFLDLMYGAFPDPEERRELDRLASLMPEERLPAKTLGIIGRYGWGDPGDENDREQALARLRRDIGRFEAEQGPTIVNRPAWLDGEQP